ncbi:MAG TPA: HEAT repeat domain-containing protein [Thermoanaerobaculia bacterium]
MTPVPAGNEVADFIRSLALAWKNLAAYPPGHPALATSLTAAYRSFSDLRGPAGEVVLGVAADGIVYGPDKIDSTQAQKFAQALYGRNVAVVRLAASTTAADIEQLLRLLTPPPGETAPPMWEALTIAGVMNIHLQPVDYSAVRVTDEIAPPVHKRESLWDDILRALVAGRELSPKSQQLLSSDIRSVDELSALILRYINTLDDVAPFDPDATFGVRLHPRPGKVADAIVGRVAETIGAHIASSTGLRRQLAVQQVIQLLRMMPEPLRGAIIQSILLPLSADESAGPQLREVAASLRHDEVIESLRHLAAAGKLSSQAMALLQSLAALDARHDALPEAPPGIVGELVQLFGEEDIDRFNPPEHQSLLAAVAINVPRLSNIVTNTIDKLGARVETVAPDAVDRQLAVTVLDLLEKHGSSRPADALLARAETVFRSQIGAGHFDEALALIDRARQITAETNSEKLRDSIATFLGRLGSADVVQSLIDSLANSAPEKAAVIHGLIDGLGAAATRNLLLTLSEEENRSRRRRVFDLVCSLGPRIVPEVISFLDDQRWYVVRNMILLLRTVNDRTSLPAIRKVAQHPDLRVRLEAIKTLLAFEASVPRTLLEEAINDRDPKMAETAIALVGNYGIKEAVDPLLQILARRDFFGSRRPLRILAIKALGELAEPRALSQMEHLFSTSFLPWPNRMERKAAFESLAAYPHDARAPFVERGLHSRDPQIRSICRKLAEG